MMIYCAFQWAIISQQTHNFGNHFELLHMNEMNSLYDDFTTSV